MRPVVHLAFDTSAAHCAAALLWVTDAGLRLETRCEEMAKGQAERLLPMIEALLAAQGLGFADVGSLSVGTGPGNFTGIRIAVSLARGLALGLGVPAVGVTGFQAARHAAARQGPHWVLIDAPRGQVYAQRFGADQGAPMILDPEQVAVLDAPAVRLSDLSADQIVRAVAEAGFASLSIPQPRPAPFYLRGADAAPPSDPPPVILP